MRNSRVAIATALMALAFGGCASVAPGTGPAASGDLFGNVEPGEVLAGSMFRALPGAGGAAPGDWQIHFQDYGRMSVRRNGQLVYEANYSVSGNELRITNREGSHGCAGPDALYSWSLVQGQLELRRRTDPCRTIGNVFHNSRWQQR